MGYYGQLRSHTGRIRVTGGRTGAAGASPTARTGAIGPARPGAIGAGAAGGYRASAARIDSSIPGCRKVKPDSNSRAGRTR